MKTIKYTLTIVFFTFLLFNCSEDQEITIEPAPDSVGEEPGNGEPGDGNSEEPATVSLDSIRPLNGPKGTLVTFYGKNFGTSEADVEVQINEKEMYIVSVEDDKIQIEVLASTYTGDIKLKVGDFESTPRVFEYEITAEVTTLAGSTRGHTEGIGQEAKFAMPLGIIMNAQGIIYVSDSNNSAIRKITHEGEVSNYSGDGCGFKNGQLENARFCRPYGIFMDNEGGLFVADKSNDAIRKIDINGNVFIAMRNYQNEIGEKLKLNTPIDYVIDSQGNKYIVELEAHRILKRTVDGIVINIGNGRSGYSDGVGLEVEFNSPRYLAIDENDNVFVVDGGNNRIRKIAPDGLVTTYAGNGYGDEDGPATKARFNKPTGIAMDSQGTIYITDSGNHKIKKISKDGMVSTLAGSNQGYKDGVGQESEFHLPYDLVVNSEGTLLYVADAFNHRIRKIILD